MTSTTVSASTVPAPGTRIGPVTSRSAAGRTGRRRSRRRGARPRPARSWRAPPWPPRGSPASRSCSASCPPRRTDRRCARSPRSGSGTRPPGSRAASASAGRATRAPVRRAASGSRRRPRCRRCRGARPGSARARGSGGGRPRRRRSRARAAAARPRRDRSASAVAWSWPSQRARDTSCGTKRSGAAVECVRRRARIGPRGVHGRGEIRVAIDRQDTVGGRERADAVGQLEERAREGRAGDRQGDARLRHRASPRRAVFPSQGTARASEPDRALRAIGRLLERDLRLGEGVACGLEVAGQCLPASGGDRRRVPP